MTKIKRMQTERKREQEEKMEGSTKMKMTMKKLNGKNLTKWIGMAALALGALAWVAGSLYAEKEDKETVVTWTIEGCTLELDAPDTIDLGTATPGDVLTSNAKDGEVEIDSTCAYTVTISLDDFTKDGLSVSDPDLQSTLLDQYSFRVESVTPGGKVENLQPTYTTFDNIGDVKDACKSKDGVSGPFKNNKCKLQFQVDTTFLPAGEYAAYHTVTASTP